VVPEFPLAGSSKLIAQFREITEGYIQSLRNIQSKASLDEFDIVLS